MTNTREWWLDLRQGLDPTAWWGPHSHPTYGVTTMVPAPLETSIKGYETVAAEGGILSAMTAGRVTVEEPNIYTEVAESLSGTHVTISSRLRTKAIDASQPFERKIFTRLRVNSRTEAATATLTVALTTDGGMPQPAPAMTIIGSTGAAWDVATWDVSAWASPAVFQEGESILNADRPRGRYAEVILTHEQPNAIQLRDFELRYLPVPRPVAV